MKYIVKRTSVWESDVSPCDGAFKDTHDRWHERTCNEQEFNERFSYNEGLWRSKGKNHSVTKEGNIIRQEENTIEWTIEINNLKELNNFIKENGCIVISPKSYSSTSPEIEIYDDYRE